MTTTAGMSKAFQMLLDGGAQMPANIEARLEPSIALWTALTPHVNDAAFHRACGQWLLTRETSDWWPALGSLLAGVQASPDGSPDLAWAYLLQMFRERGRARSPRLLCHHGPPRSTDWSLSEDDHRRRTAIETALISIGGWEGLNVDPQLPRFGFARRDFCATFAAAWAAWRAEAPTDPALALLLGGPIAQDRDNEDDVPTPAQIAEQRAEYARGSAHFHAELARRVAARKAGKAHE
jgi:hypothetical protein